MSMRTDDPITWTARDDDQRLIGIALAYFEATDALYMDDIVPDYLRNLHRLCKQYGISFAFAVAQFSHETDKARSPIFRDYRNPAGIAVEDDRNRSMVYMTGLDAAKAHVAHLVAYAYGSSTVLPQGMTEQDPNYDKVINLAWAGTIRTIRQLTGKWATDPSYHLGIVDHGNAIFPNLPDAGASPNPQEGPAMAGAIVLLTAGHRNSSGGDPQEAARTPKLARAYKAALEHSGHKVVYVQDNANDWYAGSLDGVGSWVTQQGRERFGSADNLIALDLHFEGAGAAGPVGLFSIVPSGEGLRTGAPTGGHDTDTWTNNAKDVATAHAISAGISARTGMSQRMCREKGVMDEHETGVGGDGYRLAMFAWTTPIRERAVRLVVEHGNLQRELSRIDAVDFAAKAAAGATEGLEVVFGNPADAGAPPPTPPMPAKIVYPKGFDYGVTRRAWGNQVRGKGFSEEGQVSRVWFAEKDFSPLMDWGEYENGREYFFFASGLVIGRLSSKEKFRKLI